MNMFVNRVFFVACDSVSDKRAHPMFRVEE
jgi:hypothetical protein